MIQKLSLVALVRDPFTKKEVRHLNGRECLRIIKKQ